MAKSKSSKRWLREHFDDEYVRKAQAAGYRSRAVFKLLELDEKDRLLKPSMTVVDLGAAPGGWAQIAANRVGRKGKVIALDLLPIDPLPGVEFIQGDFREDAVFDQLMQLTGNGSVDLVMSDMAPNISGTKAVDQPRAMHLVELALDFATRVLREDGDFVTKLFQGEGSDAFISEVRRQFGKVTIRKPAASRSRSSEVYLVARNYRLV